MSNKCVFLALSYYDVRIHQGVLRFVAEAGWHLNTEMTQNRFSMPRGWRGDGIIAMIPPSGKGEAACLQLIRRSGAACVIICPRPARKNLPHVTVDSVALARLAADHFLERGFRHFICFDNPRHGWINRERRQAFVRYLATKGRSCIVTHAPQGQKLNWSQQLLAYQQALRRQPRPTAVWATSDELARNILEACLHSRILVPEEVAVLGSGNHPLIAPYTRPPLSSVDSNVEELGYQGAVLLNELMKGRKPRETAICIPPKGLIERASTSTLATYHPGLRRFVEFVRGHYAEDLKKADLSRAAGMSSTGLFHACKADLGYSPGEVLKWQRLKAAEMRMLSTNDKLGVIARDTGFKNAVNFWNAFQRAHGLSPEEWKRRNRPLRESFRLWANGQSATNNEAKD
jgi:LacI family transcriptional regulator